MKPVEAFLLELDEAWPETAGKLRLRIIGSTALMLQTSYVRGTKDSDVLETDELTDDIRERLLRLAGPETSLHQRHRLYIDVVRRGVPFRRQSPKYHALVELNASLRRFDVEVMSVVDVVVSKLARFNANDQADVDAMVARELVSHGDVVGCFVEAVDFKMDLTWGEFTRYVRNLHAVERDMFGVTPTEVEEPSWLR